MCNEFDKERLSLQISLNLFTLNLFQTIGGSIMSGKSNSDIITLLTGCGASVNVETGLLLLASKILEAFDFAL